MPDIKKDKIRDIGSSLTSRERQASNDSTAFYVWIMGGLIFAGCSPSNSSSVSVSRSFEVTVHGVEGARLYSRSVSAENQIGITDSNGKAMISTRHASEPIIVSVQGATYLGEPIAGNSNLLIYEPLPFDIGTDGSVFISPLTDFLAEGIRAGTSSQAQLDAIFGEGRVSLSDVVNSDNYFLGRDSDSQDEIIGSDLTNALVHQLVSRASVAAFVLRSNPTIGGRVAEYEKMRDLFADFRTEDASVGGVDVDTFGLRLTDGDLADEVIRLLYNNPFIGEIIGSVKEDAATTTASGSIQLVDYQASYVLRYDPNTTETTTPPVDLGVSGTAQGEYGMLSFGRAATNSATITWRYTLDNNAAQVLRANQTYTEIFNIFVGPDANNLEAGVIIVYVEGTNDALMRSSTAITPPDATQDEDFIFEIPEEAFTDADTGDRLRHSASDDPNKALPAWLSLSRDGVFTGTPGGRDVPQDGSPLTIHFIVEDEGGSPPVEASFDLTIINVNDSPTPNVQIEEREAFFSSGWNFTIPADAFEDLDGDTLTYTASLNGEALPSWLMFNDGTFTINPNEGVLGPHEVIVFASDGMADSVPAGQVFTLRVRSDGNTAAGFPETTLFGVVLDNTQYNATMTEDDADHRGSISFGDAEQAPSALVITAGGKSITATGTEAERTVAGTYGNFVFSRNDETGTLSWVYTLTASGAMTADALDANGRLTEIIITLTIGDDDSHVDSMRTLALTITGIDDAPERDMNVAIDDQTVDEDSVVSFDFPADAFIDPDSTLTYSAEISADGISNWMDIGTTATDDVRFTFDPATRAFGGTPDNDDTIVGTYTIRITATGHDPLAPARDTFTLTINNVNDAPVSPDQPSGPFIYAATQDVPWEAAVGSLFEDIDPTDDMLSFGHRFIIPAGGIRSIGPNDWIQFDDATGRFYGTPSNDDVGTTIVQIRVSDNHNAFTSRDIRITVNNVNDAPEGDDNIAAQSVLTGATLELDMDNFFTDIDTAHGDTLMYTATIGGTDTGSLTWAAISNNTLTLTPLLAQVTDATPLAVVVTATDSGSLSDTASFMLSVNDAMALREGENDITAPIFVTGREVEFYIPDGSFINDGNVTLTAHFHNGTSWVAIGNTGADGVWNFDASAGRLYSERADDTSDATVRIRITATDNTDPTITAQREFNVNVVVNSPPTVIANALEARSVPAAQDLSLDITTLFEDSDIDTEHDDTLTYEAQYRATPGSGVYGSLPSGITRNGDVLSMTAAFLTAGTEFELRLSAEDESEAQAVHEVTFSAVTSPIARANIATQYVAIGATDFAFVIQDSGHADAIFSDPDGDSFANSTLSVIRIAEVYTGISGMPERELHDVDGVDAAGATAGPAWLEYDATSRTISNIASTAASGTNDYVLRVVLRDANMGTATIDVPISVAHAPVASAIPNATIDVNEEFTLNLNDYFTDADTTTLSYSVSGDNWLRVSDDMPNMLSGMATNTPGVSTFTVTARDEGREASTSFTITVEPNLQHSTDIDDQSFITGRVQQFYVPASAFMRQEEVVYSAQFSTDTGPNKNFTTVSETHVAGQFAFDPDADDGSGNIGRLYATRADGMDTEFTFRIGATPTTGGEPVYSNEFTLNVYVNGALTSLRTPSLTPYVGDLYNFRIPDVGEIGAFFSDSEDSFANEGLEVKRVVIVYQPRAPGDDEIELHNAVSMNPVGAGANITQEQENSHSYMAATRTYSVTAMDTTEFRLHLFIQDDSGSFLGYDIDITPAHAVKVASQMPTIYASRNGAVSFTIPDTDEMGALFTDMEGDNFADGSLEVVRVTVSHQGAGIGSQIWSHEIFDSLDNNLHVGSSVGPLAAWSSYNPETRTYSIAPTLAGTGTQLHITVKDEDDARAIATIPINIGYAPVLTDIMRQTATIGMEYRLDLATHFTDQDTPNLFYDITLTNGGALPSWLSLTGAVLSGTPQAGDIANHRIKVVARDLATEGQGRTVEDEFTISVVAAAANNFAPSPITDTNPFASITNYDIITGEAYQIGGQEIAVGEAVVHVRGGPDDPWAINLPEAFTDEQPIILSMRFLSGTAVMEAANLPADGAAIRFSPFANSGNGALLGRSIYTGVAGRFILEASDSTDPTLETDYILAPSRYTFAVVAHVDAPPSRIPNVFEDPTYKQNSDGSLWYYDLPEAFTDGSDEFTLTMRYLDGREVPIRDFDMGLPDGEGSTLAHFDPDGGDGHGRLFGTRLAAEGVAGNFILEATDPFDSDPRDLGYQPNEVDYLNGTDTDRSFRVYITNNRAPEVIADAYPAKISYTESVHEWRYALPAGFRDPDGDPLTLSAVGNLTEVPIPLAVDGHRPIAPQGTPQNQIAHDGRVTLAFDPNAHGGNGELIGLYGNHVVPERVPSLNVANVRITARDTGPDRIAGNQDDAMVSQVIPIEILQNHAPAINTAVTGGIFIRSFPQDRAPAAIRVEQNFFADLNPEHNGNLLLVAHIEDRVGEGDWLRWQYDLTRSYPYMRVDTSGQFEGRPNAVNSNLLHFQDYNGSVTVVAHDRHGLQSAPLRFWIDVQFHPNTPRSGETGLDPYGYIENDPFADDPLNPLESDII